MGTGTYCLGRWLGMWRHWKHEVLTRTTGHCRRGQHGAVAVETAVILPILLLLLFGIVDFGLLFHRLQGMHAAAREAARLGSLEGVEYGEIWTRAKEASPPFVDTDADLVVEVSRIRNVAGTDLPPERVSGREAPCDGSDPLVRAADRVYVRVDLHLRNPDSYGVIVPLWGSFAFSHRSTGVFTCEL